MNFNHSRKLKSLARPLAEWVEDCVSPAMKAQGFTSSDLFAAWNDIAGKTLAQSCQPLKMEWPKRHKGLEEIAKPATLVVLVESAFALELQHQIPVLIQRINAHYGWFCVGKIVLKQGPVTRHEKKSKAQPVLTDQQTGELQKAVVFVEEKGLKDALEKLGRAILGDKSS